MLTVRGLGAVLGDLAEMGYDAKWGVLGAVDAGAPHKRDRIWIVAHAAEERLKGNTISSELKAAHTATDMPCTWWDSDPADREDASKSRMGRVVNGMANRVDRIACLGNGQVPAVVRLAWEILSHDDTGRGAGGACQDSARDRLSKM